MDYDALLSRAPVTNKFLTDPNNAGVAHDDIDALSNVEGAFDSFVKESGQQHSTGTGDALSRGIGQIGLVGDTGGTDIAAACAAGAFPIGVSWGYNSAESLWAAGARAVIDDPAELLALCR